MANELFINELRIPLKDFNALDVFQITSLSLSSRHKRHTEDALRKSGWVSLFEGDVLFLMAKTPSRISEEKENVLKVLGEHIRTISSGNIKIIKLSQVPQSVTERMSYAVLSFQAFHQNIYQIYNRILLAPTPDPSKLAHRALESTVCIEDGYIKFYLNPTWIAALNIKETYREKISGTQLLHLCKFRTKNLCNLADGNGTCPYVTPKNLGYYDNEVSVDALDDSEALIFRNNYKDCPQIDGVSKVVLTRATKKAKKFSVHPTFTVFAGVSKNDLKSNSTLYRQYRDATLMLSSKRWTESVKWIKDIFPNLDVQNGKADVVVGEIKISFSVMLSVPIGYSANSSGYRSIHFSSLPVVNDKQDANGKSAGGGYLFTEGGAYDRDNVNRQFDAIVPYLIVPSNKDVQNQTQKLFDYLTDGVYETQSKYDKFFGINRPESKSKYNTRFENPWKTEEGIFEVENHSNPDEYWRAVQDVQREWNSTSQKDLNRIAIVVTPSSKENEDELYFKLKKVFIEEGIPSQFISFDTLRKLSNPSVAFGSVLQSLWLNIYSKMGGKPWRLAGQLENVHCFIGIGFGLNTNPDSKGKHIYAGVAHVFDRFGSWVDIASGSQSLSNSELESFESPQKYLQGTDSFKISETLTQDIVYNALKLYQQNQTQTHELPQNIVIHKLGPVFECEVIGILEGVRQVLGNLQKCNIGIVQIEQDHQVRMYGHQSQDKKIDKTVLRGMGLIINSQKVALASTGFTQRKNGNYYTGIGTPQPLLITSILPSASLLNKYAIQQKQFYDTVSLAKHIMALTQLHWGSTKDNIRLPITALYAQKVADLISKTNANVDKWASYHRPWFL